MREGFNTYTHDYLIRRNNELFERYGSFYNSEHEKNVEFTLEEKFLKLEYKCGDDFYIDKYTRERIEMPDEKRWCFYVAKDSDTLKIIGAQMHNCVGWGYKQAVLERKAYNCLCKI